MRVISFNANGLRAAYRKGLGEMLSALEPDILCVQEVKAQPPTLPETPAHFRTAWHCAERPGYSGVGLLSRAHPERVTCGVGHAPYDGEGRVLRADFCTDLGPLSALSVYVPSGSSGDARQAFKMAFLRDFRAHVAALLEDGRDLLICGDLNVAHQEIDLKNWRANQKTSGFLPEERAWFSGLLDLGLVDVVRAHIGPDAPLYSWWSLRSGARARNVGWRLDYQLATPRLAETVTHAAIPMTPVLSDHAPVVVDYAVRLGMGNRGDAEQRAESGGQSDPLPATSFLLLASDS